LEKWQKERGGITNQEDVGAIKGTPEESIKKKENQCNRLSVESGGRKQRKRDERENSGLAKKNKRKKKQKKKTFKGPPTLC